MAKGGDWERNVCKFLSKWVQGTEKPYIFWRGRGSGSMFTVTEGIGESFSGDIYSVRDEGKFLTDKFSIECKSGYKDASFDKHFKYNKKDFVREFWIQTIQDAIKAEKMPMLVFKKHGMPTPWLGITPETYEMLKDDLAGIRYIRLYWAQDLPDTIFMEMKEFFECVKPNDIEEKCRSVKNKCNTRRVR